MIYFLNIIVFIYQSLAIIGGGTLGLSVASCMKELGCIQVTIIERQSHCLMDINDIDREIAAYIESILVKQQIDIVTKCAVNYVTDSAVHFMSESIKSVISCQCFLSYIQQYHTILELIIGL
jgi:pyruvate/2-oxoglutarate dehydrogenase complex dihydrolipoamide dehydrogenase (E3) component